MDKTADSGRDKPFHKANSDELYSVTPKPSKQTLNIEDLWLYYSNLKVFPGTVLLPTIHGKISRL